MKTINVTFDDAEIKLLIDKKGELSWHDYILGVQLNDKRRKSK